MNVDRGMVTIRGSSTVPESSWVMRTPKGALFTDFSRNERRPRVSRDVLLEPTRPEAVIYQAELRTAAPALEADLQGRDQLQQQRIAQEFQVVGNALGTDLAPRENRASSARVDVRGV